MKKIISILMISIVCISNFIGIFGTNKVKAAIAPIENAKPYSKGEVVYPTTIEIPKEKEEWK